MEVIHLDLSDDDDDEDIGSNFAASSTNGVAAAGPRHLVTQDTKSQSDEDGVSVDSCDSIWDKPGLQSSKKPSKTYNNALKSDDVNSDEEELEVIKVGTIPTTTNAHTPPPPTSTVDAFLGEWKVMLLMDHREFGCKDVKKSNFLNIVEKKINKHFGGTTHNCEITTLPSADYLFVARLISHSDKKSVIDERVFNLIIERKDVNDLTQCLILDSKKYKPLSFFEAQMYKLLNCGIANKLFLMEGDEEDPTHFNMAATKTFSEGRTARGFATKDEQSKRLLRVKTARIQIEKGEWSGVDLLCTKNKDDTVKYLIQQLEKVKREFDPLRPPALTMAALKNKIDTEMKKPTFQEYLRLQETRGVGNKKALKIIIDPKLDWDKTFVSPVSSKTFKSTLQDRATFWGESESDAVARHLANARKQIIRNKKSNGKYAASNRNADPSCGLCRKPMDIFEAGVATCNRVAKCGQVFHNSCLALQNYDIGKADGCIMCRGLTNFSTKSQVERESNAAAASSSASAASRSKATASTTNSRANPPKSKSKTAKTSSPSTSATVPSTTSSKQNTKSAGKKRPPPERVYINHLPKGKPKPVLSNVKRTSFEGNGAFSNPLNDVDNSVAAALLLGDEPHLTVERDPSRSSVSATTKPAAVTSAKKSRKCGICQACLRRDDCAKCKACLDKTKFGGPNKMRKKCLMKQCTSMINGTAASVATSAKKRKYIHSNCNASVWAEYDREHGNAHPKNVHLSQQRSQEQMNRYNKPHQLDSGSWTCMACTFLNENPSDMVCTICGTAKKKAPVEEEGDDMIIIDAKTGAQEMEDDDVIIID